MWWYIITGILIIGFFFLFNWMVGYRKGHIQIDFDERYGNHKEYVRAIKKELKEQGYEVNYNGDYKFSINGKPYVFLERNVSIGCFPLQRTILKPVKR